MIIFRQNQVKILYDQTYVLLHLKSNEVLIQDFLKKHVASMRARGGLKVA